MRPYGHLHKWYTHLFILAAALCIPAKSGAEILFETKGGTLEDWDVLDFAGDGKLRIIEDSSAPPGFGPAVMRIEATRMIMMARGVRTGKAVLTALWRELEPDKRDTDGVILFSSQYRDDIQNEHNTKALRYFAWFEQDNDSGIHVSRITQDGQEKILKEAPGVGMTGDPWNRTGWIWQKLQIDGDQLHAKFWPAHLPEPKDWQFDLQSSEFKEGRVGLFMASCMTHLAYYAVDTVDTRIKTPAWYLHAETSRITTASQFSLTLFANLEEAVSANQIKITVSDTQGVMPCSLPNGFNLQPGHNESILTFSTPKQSASFPEGGVIMPLNRPLASGTIQVEIQDGQGTVLAKRSLELLPREEIDTQLEGMSQTIKKTEEILAGLKIDDRRTRCIRVSCYAADAHLQRARQLFDDGVIDDAERSLEFARQALEELEGYQKQWLQELEGQS